MSLAERHPDDDQPRFTYGDYIQWSGDERWELIDGIAYLMSPAPSRAHQRLQYEIARQLGNQLEGHPCELAGAPFDIRLPESDEADEDVPVVVQPDLAIFCDPNKTDEKGGRGAPDFIIEILSPATASRDKTLKAKLYERHGVREYWIIDPGKRSAEVRILGKDGHWQAVRHPAPDETVSLTAVPGLKVNLAKAFAAMTRS
jgi:Uma2 family endonuclease